MKKLALFALFLTSIAHADPIVLRNVLVKDSPTQGPVVYDDTGRYWVDRSCVRYGGETFCREIYEGGTMYTLHSEDPEIRKELEKSQYRTLRGNARKFGTYFGYTEIRVDVTSIE